MRVLAIAALATLVSCAALKVAAVATGLTAAYTALDELRRSGAIDEQIYVGLRTAFDAIAQALGSKVDTTELAGGASAAVLAALGVVRAWRGTAAPPEEKAERKRVKRAHRHA